MSNILKFCIGFRLEELIVTLGKYHASERHHTDTCPYYDHGQSTKLKMLQV